jgi:DNA repair protein RecN (Recombination protein N)
LEESEVRVATLNSRMNAVQTDYLNAATVLHESRADAAERLSKAVGKQLGVLGMLGSVFTINVHRETDSIRSHGTDHVDFVVSTNPGQAALPLARVASGGELSRISLALQVVTTGGTGIPTIIFDEVDVGIGGDVAEVVGQHMHGLGRHRQVLCVTHLPQVASQADAHVQVQKKTTKTRVQTRFQQLADAGRVEEIARMLGGLQITARTRAHAREMLARD